MEVSPTSLLKIRMPLASAFRIDIRHAERARFSYGLAAIVVMFVLQSIHDTRKAIAVDFERDVRPIFEQHCYECHSGDEPESGLRLDIRSEALKGGDQQGPDIVPGNSRASPLVQVLTTENRDQRMPPDAPLSAEQIATIRDWIDQGAIWPEGIDTAKLRNRRDHWAFQPLKVSSQATSIDALVDAQLAACELSRSPPATPRQWLRRVTYDLHGLPPTPSELNAFELELNQSDAPESVYREAVERLLASPRYGERWAQHWLDVVRYADTHGFEVNTERPNAWPYRDYVIRAMNADTPYNEFIRQQLIGDQLGEDAATGFMITASVLLPAQIGKDEPSIRLARQDALDEIVNNVGQTFLGLSIGCARCHDHKFDPISSRDYYAMQAFVAGVEYEDRPMRTAEAAAQAKLAASLSHQVEQIERRLVAFTPLANPGTTVRQTKADQNTELFASRVAKFVRLTIDDANVHPSLGLLEPCIDEFEIYTSESPTQNIALASHGTKVIASGSRVSQPHRLEHINDGVYGNASSWMSDKTGTGWVLFELPEPASIDRVVWGRDRTGKFEDRLAIAYRLEVGETLERMQTVAQAIPYRPAVNRRGTTDRFAPQRATRLRFTVSATNSLDPCLDELEVFDEHDTNVALASFGTKVKTSGEQFVPDRHSSSYINDGLYGNSRSWLGNEPGKGWVELEFPSAQTISRVVWSRDRDGPFEDRLPIEYRIEIYDQEQWHLVADSTDRKPWVAGIDLGPSFRLAGLSVEDRSDAEQLLNEKRSLEIQIKSLESGQLCFAGKFRSPDTIYRLNRGDPEQPQEEVAPAVPAAFAALTLPASAPESERRTALANWIADPANPLTARVMVNRIWQGHFGTGIVDTPSDFGWSGARPTHPELLDWLADRFIRDNWSIKSLHRLIVLSETYRQSSAINNSQALEKDADARLLWRYPNRRLEAEVLRDSMLAISGELNLKMYGRGFDLFDKRGGLSGFNPVESHRPSGLRRMIYAHKVRREREAVFGVFDCPDAGQSSARRRESTTPLQALNLLNSQFTLERSAAFAKRLVRECGSDLQQQIRFAFELAHGRLPSDDELNIVEPLVREQGLEPFCRALLNSNEMLFPQ